MLLLKIILTFIDITTAYIISTRKSFISSLHGQELKFAVLKIMFDDVGVVANSELN